MVMIKLSLVKNFRFCLVILIWVVTLPGLLSLGSCDDKDPSPKPPPPTNGTEIGKVQYWLTKGDRSVLLSRQGDLSLVESQETFLPLVTVDAAQVYQTMEGFGAALTGSSAYLINQKLNASQRQALLQELFDPVIGIGINALRLTIGASDFSLTDFTYNDIPAGQTDYPLNNFTIDAEQTDLLPVLKSITSLAPDLTVIASPWTAPAWMKTNGSLHGGSLKPEAYEVYANYFLKYIQAMKNEGIAIDAVTVQNEPLHTAGYPTMSMSADEQKTFVRNNLGPVLTNANTGTGIIIYDHNWDNTQYAISILNDPVARQFVIGTAFHAYAGNVSAMSTVRNAHPDKGLYFTEISGGEWATDFAGNLQWNMANIFIGTTQNWSRTALLWNLALDQNFGPTNNGCANCRGVVTIHATTGNITRNVEYYSIGHFSRFVRNGAQRIGSGSSVAVAGVDHVAFKNADGRKVIVFSNSGNTQQSVAVREGARQFSITLPSSSVATVTWE
jgi:glucosylceramidase